MRHSLIWIVVGLAIGLVACASDDTGATPTVAHATSQSLSAATTAVAKPSPNGVIPANLTLEEVAAIWPEFEKDIAVLPTYGATVTAVDSIPMILESGAIVTVTFDSSSGMVYGMDLAVLFTPAFKDSPELAADVRRFVTTVGGPSASPEELLALEGADPSSLFVDRRFEHCFPETSNLATIRSSASQFTIEVRGCEA
jgi:hypothetical protein